MHGAYIHGSVLIWQHCNMLSTSTSSFVDDIMILYHGASGPESSTVL